MRSSRSYSYVDTGRRIIKISVGFGSLAAQHHLLIRVVFVVYGQKLIHSLTPPFIFNQHNAQNGQKTPGDSQQRSLWIHHQVRRHPQQGPGPDRLLTSPGTPNLSLTEPRRRQQLPRQDELGANHSKLLEAYNYKKRANRRCAMSK